MVPPVMVSFQFEASKNGDLTADLTGSISGSLITVEIPGGELAAFKSAFDDLTPSFTAQGAVSVNGAEQVSGKSLDFRGPVFYEITNSAGEKRIYEVEFKSGNLAYIPDSTFRAYLKSLRELSSAFDGEWLETDDSGLASVKTINLENQPIRSAQGVQYFPNLEILKITPTILPNGNQLKIIDLRANTKLTELSLINHQFSSIDLSQNTELTELTISYNPNLTHVDLSDNKKLVILNLSFVASLSSVDLSQNTVLEKLVMNDISPKLESLDLSQNTRLEDLQIRSADSQSPLKNLDIRGFRDDSKNFAIHPFFNFSDLKKLKVHENLKDNFQVKALKEKRGDALTIEVYSAADGSTEYTLVDGDYTPS